MVDKIRRRIVGCMIFVLCLLPVIIAARIMIVVTYIDPQTLFYERDTQIPDLFNYAVYFLSLLMLCSGFMFRWRFKSASQPKLKRDVGNFGAKIGSISDDGDVFGFEQAAAPVAKKGILERFMAKENSPRLNIGTRLIFENSVPSAVFASTLTGFIFIASAILIFGGMVWEKHFGVIEAVTLIAAVMSGFYFIIAGMKNVYPYSRAFGFMSFFPAAWCALRLISGFLDMSQESNEYSHILQIACLVFLTLFFYCEGRFSVPNPAFYNLGLYLGSAFASLIIIATVSLPNLLLASFWMVDFNTGVFNSLVEFTIAIYIITKLFSIIRKLERMHVSQSTVNAADEKA